MAHFRAVIKGTQGEASRLGDKKNGISAKVQTWGQDLLISVQHCSPEAAEADRTLEAGDWAVIEIAPHGSEYGKMVARVNLTTGKIIVWESR